MHYIVGEVRTGDEDGTSDSQNDLILACIRGEVSVNDVSPDGIEPQHLYMAIDRPTPVPALIRWILDTLPLSLIQAYRDPDTDLTPMEVLMQSILGQEEWRRYHREENTTRMESSWKCVRLIAVKVVECHPDTPTLHACLLLYLQRPTCMPFSLLQKALQKFSHEALDVDPNDRLPFQITLAALESRRRIRGVSSSVKDDSDDEDDTQELVSLAKKVLELNPAAAHKHDPEGRLPVDIAIATECHDLACQLAQIYSEGLGIRSRFPSSLVFCTLLERSPLNVSFGILREVSNYL
ncbi:hypothetical protein FisN_21Lh245 [Fistulifera solaris]|uniref:Uncharacterized protein n=1 Tax=Fistulifera solaris TaxID=1519565 RepID=A0A1Z5KF02_FISSO|nr:hypothetical protein FisN_21Lh245 [Fistulifera solaris]|eukprot:GAX24651.1 hypothetical protein FisN_21Lh245 [Fistulifera solaris]